MTKSQYWQKIRGICILAVIMIHCPNGYSYSNVDYIIWMILRQAINFPVALFVFMSGFFVNSEKCKGNYKAYIMNRGGRLLVPYLMWSVIYLIKRAFSGGDSAAYIVYSLVAGKAATPLYYIVVMLQLTILTPFLVKNRKTFLYFITPLYLLMLYGYNIVTKNMPILYETVFPSWLFFYILGMDCRTGRLEKIIERVNVVWILVALCLSILEAYILLRLGCADNFAFSQIKFSSFLYATVIALWLMKKNKATGQNLLSVIGDCSYGIFYFHMLAIWGINKLLNIIGLDKIWCVAFGVTFIAVAFCSVAIVWGTRQVVKNKIYLKIIGFE